MEQKDYRLAAIMYTDIAGFSRMMEHDEAGTLELLRFHNELLGGIVAAHHGTVIKTIGDALLVDFKNTVEAMQSAMEIQDRLYAHNKEHGDLPLLVRIGVHLGDIYFFENDALGEGINIAARLQSLARPGCICFSGDVYNLVLNKIEFRAEKLGKVSLKNITKEIHAYEITTPNVEFDPNKDKPRPGFKPGTYLHGEEGEAGEGGEEAPPEPNLALSHAPAAPKPYGRPAQPPALVPQAEPPAPRVPASVPVGRIPDRVEAPPVPAATGAEPDRSYSPEGSRRVLDEIKKAILQDIKAEGRRLTVDEAKARYGHYGVEASEVIASMVESGLLVRSRPLPSPPPAGAPRPGEYRPGEYRPEDFRPEDIGRNIEAAVKGIVGEIERHVERAMEDRGRDGQDYGQDYGEQVRERHRERYERHRERYERHQEKYRAKLERFGGPDEGLATDKWDRKLQENEAWSTRREEGSATMEAYRSQLTTKARRQRGGFIGNLTSYLAVNAGLFYIYTTFAPHALWAYIVASAWGIGLVSSFVAARRGGLKAREAEALPDLEGESLAAYKKLNRARDSMAMHLASTLTVPVLLGILNFCYPGGPAFLWFLIPTVAMVLSCVSHFGSFNATRRKLQRQILESQGVEGGWRNLFRAGKTRRANGSALGPYAGQYEEAERAKDAILREVAGSAYDAGMGPSLDSYVGQVKLLAQSANEIERIVGAIPMGDLSKDKEALLAKSREAGPGLQAEYRKSIEEIERQEKSYEELQNQSELIKLRLSSSVNQLKQMRLDVARLKAAGDDGSGGMDDLRKRTDELSVYLSDLRKGYDEGLGAKDPFAELEAAEKARSAPPPNDGN